MSEAVDRIPDEVRDLFWDADLDGSVVERSPTYVIERVLEEGGPPAIRWLRRRYGDPVIGGVVRRSRRLTRRTANFWGLFLGIPRSEIACFQKPSPDVRGPFS